jgi:hypothetical protein
LRRKPRRGATEIVAERQADDLHHYSDFDER